MAVLKKIGELPNLGADSVSMNGNNALGVIALENEAYSASMSDIMEGIGRLVEFSGLDTGNQTIIGAINEIYAFMHNYVVFCTQAEYDALTTYENKFYLITDGSAGGVDEVIGNTIENVVTNVEYIPYYKFYTSTNTQPSGTLVKLKTFEAPNAHWFGAYSFLNQNDLTSVLMSKAAWEDLGITNLNMNTAVFAGCSNLVDFRFKEDNYLGITTTPITVNSTTSSIVIDGETISVSAGDVVYDSVNIDCFKWDGSKWIDYSPVYTVSGGGASQNLGAFGNTKFPFFNFLLNSTGQYYWSKMGVVRLSYNPGYTGRTSPNAQTFEGNSHMERLDCWNTMSSMSANSVLANCSNLKILTLPYNGVVSISAANLNATKIGQGTADSKVFVPSDKIEQYKVATNWADAYALAVANGNQLFYPID